MREFNVGDKVKCIDAGSINRELKNGETYIVSPVDTNGFVKLKGLSSYYYDPSRFKKIEYTYEDLKKAPIGTKITFEDGKVLIKTEENRFENRINVTYIGEINNHFKDKILGKIIKIEEPTYTTVYEAKKEILDEAEKRYLRGVVRPYKDVKSIQKYIFFDKKLAKIQIFVLDIRGTGCWSIDLPPFKKDTMYKNMEDNKAYTTEELGL